MVEPVRIRVSNRDYLSDINTVFAITLIFALVGLIWGAIFAFRGNLLLGCVGVLIATSVFGSYFLNFDVAGITLTLDRLALVGLVAAFVVQWKLDKLEVRPLCMVDWVIGGFFAVMIVNAFTHDWRSAMPDQVPVVQHIINGYLIPLTIYIIARNLRYTEKNTTWFLIGMTVFGLYLAVIGIFEGTGQYGLVFPRYIADPELGLHFSRARGPMVHSVSYGVYLTGCLLCAWLLRDRVSPNWRTVITILLPAFLAAIYFTKTRTVWLGAGGSLMLAFSLTLQGRTRKLVIGSMLAVGLCVGVAKMDSIMGLQREGTVQDTRKSVSMRASFTYVSWQMFLDSPITGHGFGQFKTEKMSYLSDRNVDLLLESIRTYDHHNTFLSILTELGLLGLIPFLLIYLLWAKTGVSLQRNKEAPQWAKNLSVLSLGMLFIACCQMIGHEITYTPIDHLLIFMTAGICVALRQQFSESCNAVTCEPHRFSAAQTALST
ncbi:MAG: hypothetical protein COA78_22640 [Blastopirellula sp.]|nr:MAG: hypothetical protein COA78_22640 [Blastopirellula sp.]